MVPYEDCILYGPYIYNDDGRIFYVTKDKKGKKKNVTRARYMMEIYLNRYLTREEVVHHINHNPLDDRIENLVLVTRTEHTQNHKVFFPQQGDTEYTCPECGKAFIVTTKRKQKRDFQARNGNIQAGPFCSSRCAGIASHN